MISNRWGDAKYWANEASKEGYKVNDNPSVGSFFNIQKVNMVMLHM